MSDTLRYMEREKQRLAAERAERAERQRALDEERFWRQKERELDDRRRQAQREEHERWQDSNRRRREDDRRRQEDEWSNELPLGGLLLMLLIGGIFVGLFYVLKWLLGTKEGLFVTSIMFIFFLVLVVSNAAFGIK